MQSRVQRREATSITDGDRRAFARRTDSNTDRRAQSNPLGYTAFNSVVNPDRRADNNADADTVTAVTSFD